MTSITITIPTESQTVHAINVLGDILRDIRNQQNGGDIMTPELFDKPYYALIHKRYSKYLDIYRKYYW